MIEDANPLPDGRGDRNEIGEDRRQESSRTNNGSTIQVLAGGESWLACEWW
jgi:hypothetical protein